MLHFPKERALEEAMDPICVINLSHMWALSIIRGCDMMRILLQHQVEFATS